ncbi:Tripartite tricarboxylate transporter TctB family protein [Devosia enhydra]|uniref:Tripartite tricarboxylate transporter TctB family protein n=1 Tax=Devosia enhydra TaxID=665118 RepID=A0A1K2HUW8_9HYPH|nr:tripartite tricarboxylate transporter TctB family protein [Devosia enhydra]SFZ81426.1 Tripartite tricarboxylate transporter TctB family protein [Devosia enhydra]
MIKDYRLFWSALGLVALGGTFALLSLGYPLGTLHRMGPGFFPLVLGFILAGLGLVILLGAGTQTLGAAKVAWRPLGFISAAILAFGLLIGPFGLLPATFVAALLSAFADASSRPLPVVVYSAVLTAGVWAVFVLVLGIPFTAIRGVL